MCPSSFCFFIHICRTFLSADKNAEENGKVGQIPQVHALHPWRHGGGLRCDVASG